MKKYLLELPMYEVDNLVRDALKDALEIFEAVRGDDPMQMDMDDIMDYVALKRVIKYYSAPGEADDI